ncbi:hypothetical protein [Devosia sp.]|uniref:hypothetical protein n=1 Tax=Devosia sp. TaxID=1871048 RepID=UPI003BAAEF26
MEIKEAEPMLVLSARRTLTIPQVKSVAAEITAAIDADIKRDHLEIAGPWVFVAQNLPKDGSTDFDVRFCRPVVSASDYVGAFETHQFEPIMVASAIYQGPMRTLFTQGYAPLVREIEHSRHTFSGESREIYHQWAGQGAKYHRIEIQFGLAY